MLGLRVDVDEREVATVLAVGGELDLGSAPRLRDAALKRIHAGDRAIVLDLAGLEFLDSTGLGVVVAILKRARSLGVDLRLVVTRDRVRAPFELTGVDGLLPLHDDREAAVLAATEAVVR